MLSFVTITSLLLLQGSSAFTSVPSSAVRTTSASTSTTAVFAIPIDDIEDIGYYTMVKKPLGVVFGENPQPYSGLRVDDVEGAEGGSAGLLRVGDQLLAIDGEVTIGTSFDSCMAYLTASPSSMELLMYRGSVRDLYTILNNRNIEDDEADTDNVAVVMDENYESPVRIEVKEDKGINLGRVFTRLTGGDPDSKPAAADTSDTSAAAPKKEKKKGGGGLFGMFGESIQLEGEDGTGKNSFGKK